MLRLSVSCDSLDLVWSLTECNGEAKGTKIYCSGSYRMILNTESLTRAVCFQVQTEHCAERRNEPLCDSLLYQQNLKSCDGISPGKVRK